MKIAVSTYSFSKLGISQFECIKLSKELGFDGIEFAEITPHNDLTKLEYAKFLRDECERVNLPIANFCFGADFLNNDLTEEIKKTKNNIDIAQVLGVHTVRHDATVGNEHYKSFDLALPIISGVCREVTVYAAEKGIKTTVENHGYFCQGSQRVKKLVAAVNHENFGLLADMGNFLFADEDPKNAFDCVAKYAFYVHAKDFIVYAEKPENMAGVFTSRGGKFLKATIVGQGNVPIPYCVDALQRAGYDGYISIEFEGNEDTITALKNGLTYLRHLK